MATLPAFYRHTDLESPPPVDLYHPLMDTIVLIGRCIGRRTDSDHCDRRWKPLVYAAYQCKNRPALTIDGEVSDLCATCQGNEAASTPGGKSHEDWNGRITGLLPFDSKIAGSVWFDRKATWLGTERPKTRRMEERAPRRRLVADLEIQRFLRGTITLNIERLTLDNQIAGQQLRNAVCTLVGRPHGADCINRFNTRERLCALIRILMDPSITPKPTFTIHYPKKKEEE